jgi:periplasmic protein CpxP/Spy
MSVRKIEWRRGLGPLAVGLALSMASVGVYAAGESPTADGPGRHGPGGRRFGMMRMAGALDLTEEQQASLKQMIDEQRKAAEPLVQQMRDLRQQIREQLDSEGADATTIGQLTIQAHNLGKQLRAAHQGMQERFESILTPEQKAKLEQLKTERGNRGFGRPGRFGPRPGTKEPGSDGNTTL